MENYSILCVDDEANVVEALSYILTKAGYTVHTALSGVDALNILEEEKIDIAIIDYKMPEMSGIDLLKRIEESYLDVEVLILTAHGSIENAVEFIKLGAFDYVLTAL